LFTSVNLQEVKPLLDNGWPQLEEGVNYKAMGLKWYREIVIPQGWYRGMDNRNHANRLGTISPSVPPAEHEMPLHQQNVKWFGSHNRTTQQL